MRELTPVAAPMGSLLESPRWSDHGGLLSWVDIPTGRLFTLDPTSGDIETHYTGEAPLGAALPGPPGYWTLLGRDGARTWRPEGEVKEALRVQFSDTERISNDAAFDPWGRLYVGRMSPEELEGEAALIAVETDGTVRVVAEGLTIPNGLAWSPDHQWMYFAESIERRVYRIPVTQDGEDWSRREVVIQFEAELPDGIVIGPDGLLWVACHGSGTVKSFTLAGELVDQFALPVSQVTACAFIGRDLYVTSGAEDFCEEDREREPLAGSMFTLPNASKGAA